MVINFESIGLRFWFEIYRIYLSHNEGSKTRKKRKEKKKMCGGNQLWMIPWVVCGWRWGRGGKSEERIRLEKKNTRSSEADDVQKLVLALQAGKFVIYRTFQLLVCSENIIFDFFFLPSPTKFEWEQHFLSPAQQQKFELFWKLRFFERACIYSSFRARAHLDFSAVPTPSSHERESAQAGRSQCSACTHTRLNERHWKRASPRARWATWHCSVGASLAATTIFQDNCHTCQLPSCVQWPAPKCCAKSCTKCCRKWAKFPIPVISVYRDATRTFVLQ